MASGAKLEIVDVDISSGNISLTCLKDFCKDKSPAAVFVTDYGGIPVSVSELRSIVGPDCYILVDAAASLGTRYMNENGFIHSMADFVCYSFDAMKLITCGEGGAAVIKDQELREKFKEYSYLGLPSKQKSGLDVAKGAGNAGWWEYELKCLGRRSVMSDLSAGLGLSQMTSIYSKLEVRQRLRSKYELCLSEVKEIEFLKQNTDNFYFSNYFYTIYTEERDILAAFLLENNVYTSYRYWPVHKMAIFQDGCIGRDFPASDYMAEKALNLPIHDSLSEKNVEEICQIIRSFVSRS
jgi:aminotransferase